MKRSMKLLSLILAMVFVMSAFSGCDFMKASEEDDSMDTVYIDEGGQQVAVTEALKLGVRNMGYGEDFAYELAAAFEAKTGIKTIVSKSSSADWVETAVMSGGRNNDIDVIFDINPTRMRNVAINGYLEGYERAYVDLSDIYDQPLEGYNTNATMEEMLLPYAVEACTWGGEDKGFGDGKQYFVNWAPGIEGLMYNATLFQKYNLEVPKTTNQLLALMEQIKSLNNGKYPVNDEGYTIYPLVYAGAEYYLEYPTQVWCVQYDGLDAYQNRLQGKDVNGNYSPECMKTAGRLSAYSIVSKILDQDNGYTDPNSRALSFTDAQVMFLVDQAFMMSTGDWLEREMSGNAGLSESEIRFMPVPMNSDVASKLKSIGTEEKLVEVLSYIDGETAERPSYVSDEDLAYLQDLRGSIWCEGNQHIAYIPAYSDNIPAAKKFLQFMLSKEGMEIMLEYAYGGAPLLNVDYTQFDYYAELSALQKSKLDIIMTGNGANLLGGISVYPMAYAGGLGYTMTRLEGSFGVYKGSTSYLTPLELWQDEFEGWSVRWKNMMSSAGLSNG